MSFPRAERVHTAATSCAILEDAAAEPSVSTARLVKPQTTTSASCPNDALHYPLKERDENEPASASPVQQQPAPASLSPVVILLRSPLCCRVETNASSRPVHPTPFGNETRHPFRASTPAAASKLSLATVNASPSLPSLAEATRNEASPAKSLRKVCPEKDAASFRSRNRRFTAGDDGAPPPPTPEAVAEEAEEEETTAAMTSSHYVSALFALKTSAGKQHITVKELSRETSPAAASVDNFALKEKRGNALKEHLSLRAISPTTARTEKKDEEAGAVEELQVVEVCEMASNPQQTTTVNVMPNEEELQDDVEVEPLGATASESARPPSPAAGEEIEEKAMNRKRPRREASTAEEPEVRCATSFTLLSQGTSEGTRTTSQSEDHSDSNEPSYLYPTKNNSNKGDDEPLLEAHSLEDITTTVIRTEAAAAAVESKKDEDPSKCCRTTTITTADTALTGEKKWAAEHSVRTTVFPRFTHATSYLFCTDFHYANGRQVCVRQWRGDQASNAPRSDEDLPFEVGAPCADREMALTQRQEKEYSAVPSEERPTNAEAEADGAVTGEDREGAECGADEVETLKWKPTAEAEITKERPTEEAGMGRRTPETKPIGWTLTRLAQLSKCCAAADSALGGTLLLLQESPAPPPLDQEEEGAVV